MAAAGSLGVLVSLGTTGALAGPPAGLVAGAKPAAAGLPTTTPSAGTPTTGATGATTGTQGVSTIAASSVPTTPTPAVQTPAPVGPIVVTMTATPQVARIGQTVTYTADVSGAPPGKKIVYSWAYEGGVATGRQISHSYQTPGDYPVAVTVTVTSVVGLGGYGQQLTHVVPNSPPSKLHGSGSSNGGGNGSGHGKGGGSGTGSSSSGAARAAKRAKAIRAQGVANPLPTRAPSALAGQQVDGFLLTDVGTPFVPPIPAAPTSASSSPGGSDAGPAGAGGAAAVGGAIALTIAIVTLGALDERRRITLRNA